MFVPPEYRPDDPEWLIEVIRSHPLACLVTNGPDGPRASHVPVIPDPEQFPSGMPAREGEVAGRRLFGHMNRLNPHWAALQGGAQALLVFQGPNGYVSPTVYEYTPAAPTWDFTAVHVRGWLEPVGDRESSLQIITETVAAYERDLGTGWDMTESLGYFRQLLPGVGAFRLAIDTVDGMFKLSQEQSPEVRERVACEFAARAEARGTALAEHIQRTK